MANEWPTSMLVLVTLIALFMTVMSGVISGSGFGGSVGGCLTGILLCFTTARIMNIAFWLCLIAIATTSVVMGSNWIGMGWALGFAVTAWVYVFMSSMHKKLKK